MPSSNACWGIELGSGAIKAVRLVRAGGVIRADQAVVIPHRRPLTDPGLDPNDAMRVALGELVNRLDLRRASIAISMPGSAGFIRFIKLPPAAPKQLPPLIRFEATQQIPFPLEDVEWDYQPFVADDSPEVEVGIFAIARQRITERLALYQDVDLAPTVVSLSPLAAFNAIAYDQAFHDNTPGTVIVDVGTASTDLIVYEAGRMWVRTFPMGGHSFTEAVASAFGLPYNRAERLKCNAARHEKQKQIFQAMKTVYADFTREVQQSLQYYTASHPNADLRRAIGLGATFQLIGLRRALSARLEMDVVRLTSYERLDPQGEALGAVESSALQLATAYGLALQGLGRGAVGANLIPTALVRDAIWRAKRPWAIAAASLAVVAGAVPYAGLAHSASQAAADRDANEQAVRRVLNEGQGLKRAWDAVKDESGYAIGAESKNLLGLRTGNGVHGQLAKDLGAMLASAEPPASLRAGEAPAGDIAPDAWSFFRVVSFEAAYSGPGDARAQRVQFAGSARADGGNNTSRSRRRDAGRDKGRPSGFGSYFMTLVIDTGHRDRKAFVDRTLLEWLRANAGERSAVPYTLAELPDLDAIQADAVPGAKPSKESGTLGSLAPLGAALTDFPEGVQVQRYTLTWRAVLRDPATVSAEAAALAMPAGEERSR